MAGCHDPHLSQPPRLTTTMPGPDATTAVLPQRLPVISSSQIANFQKKAENGLA